MFGLFDMLWIWKFKKQVLEILKFGDDKILDWFLTLEKSSLENFSSWLKKNGSMLKKSLGLTDQDVDRLKRITKEAIIIKQEEGKN